MSTSHFPICPFCGRSSYAPMGSTIAPGFHQMGYRCEHCEAIGVQIGTEGGAVLALIELGQMGPDINGSRDYPKVLTTWLDKVVMPAWRDRADKRAAHEKMEFRAFLAEKFYPTFPHLKGYVPAERVGSKHAESYFTDETISFSECPPETQKFYRGFFPDNGPRGGCYMPYPAELQAAVYPPQMPEMEGVVVYYWSSEKNWWRVDREISCSHPAVEDPILVDNRAFFAEVWAQLKARGHEIEGIAEAPNEYSPGMRPWFTFKHGGLKVTLGWRKRVVSIHVDSGVPFALEALEAAAKRDQTTFELSSNREGVLVHAWGQAKVIEYLELLLDHDLGAPENP